MGVGDIGWDVFSESCVFVEFDDKGEKKWNDD